MLLAQTSVPLVALLEIKVRRENVNQVANKVFGGWQWYTNADYVPKVRIWVAWQGDFL